MNSKKKTKSFSIIVLIIVIAVIAILATVYTLADSGIIGNTQNRAAGQAAKTAYTEYITGHAADGELVEYYLFESDGGRIVSLRDGEIVEFHDTREAALQALFDDPNTNGDESFSVSVMDTEIDGLFSCREVESVQLVIRFDTVADLAASEGNLAACDNSSMPFTYENLRLFEGCSITKINLFVTGNAYENNDNRAPVPLKDDQEYTFNILLLDASSVKKGGTYAVKKTYTLTVLGKDVVKNAWNTFDVSHLGITVGKGETLGFGDKDSTLEIYYLADKSVSQHLHFFCTPMNLSLRPIHNVLVGVEGVDMVKESLREILRGKYLSVLGASICTYGGYSDDTHSNSNIGNNVEFYPQGDVDTVGDTFWMQLIKEFDMELLVNNSSSGSKILQNVGNIVAAYMDRCVQLHADTGANEGKDPNVIISSMGINDYITGASAGTVDESLFAWADQYIAGEATSRPDNFAEGYAVMVAKMVHRYPDAKIFLCTMPASNKQFGDVTCDMETAEKFGAVISAIAEHYGCYTVDLTHGVMSGANYNKYTVGDNLHPNAAGMDIWTELVIDAMKECYFS